MQFDASIQKVVSAWNDFLAFPEANRYDEKKKV